MRKESELLNSVFGLLFLVGLIYGSYIGIKEAIRLHNNTEYIMFATSSPIDSGEFVSNDSNLVFLFEGNGLFICNPDTKRILKSYQLSGNNTAFTAGKIYEGFINEENKVVNIKIYPLLGGENAYKGYNCFIENGEVCDVYEILKK